MKMFWKKLCFIFIFFGFFQITQETLFAQESSVTIIQSKLTAINTIANELPRRFCSSTSALKNCPELTESQKNEIKLEITWFNQMASEEANKTEEPSGTTKEKTIAGSTFIISLYQKFSDYLTERKNTSLSQNQKLADIANTSATLATLQIQLEQNKIAQLTGVISSDQATDNAIKISQAKKTTQGDPDPAGCSLTNLDPAKCIDGIIGWFIKVTLVNLSLSIFYICGLFLHYAISFGLISIKQMVDGNEGIYTLWLFTRNLVATGVIFVLFYLAILYLLDLQGSLKKVGVRVLLFAFISSFSYGISTSAIDLSNMVTVTLYNNIAPDWSTSLDTPTIATKYINLLGYSGWGAFTGADENSILGKSVDNKIATNLLLALTMMYNSFVLLMLGLLFIVRDLGLLLGIILSPLFFVDQTIPKLGEWARWFRKFFIGQLALGPVFMLLMYVGIKITDVVKLGLTNAPKGNFGLIFFNLLAVTSVFYFTLKFCKQLSGILADVAIGTAGSLATKAMIATPLGAAGQLASFAGKNTVGALGRYASRDGGMLDRMQGGFFGDKAYSAAKYAGNNATYDFNNSKFFANAKSTMSSKMGMTNGALDAKNGVFGVGIGYEEARQSVKKDTERYRTIKDTETRESAVAKRIARFGKTNLSGELLTNEGRERRQMTLHSLSEASNKLTEDQMKAAEKKLQSDLKDKVDSDNFINPLKRDTESVKKLKDEIKSLREEAAKGQDPKTKELFEKMIADKLGSAFLDEIKSDKNINVTDVNFVAGDPSKEGDGGLSVIDKKIADFKEKYSESLFENNEAALETFTTGLRKKLITYSTEEKSEILKNTKTDNAFANYLSKGVVGKRTKTAETTQKEMAEAA